MKKLFQNAIEWLRSRVTAIVKVKGDRLKRSEVRTPKIERLHSNDDRLKVKGDGFSDYGKKVNVNSQLSIVNSKLTIPDIETLLREKYELRYNVLTEQSEYRAKGSDAPFAAVTQRVYKTWMADLQADGYNVWWAEGVRIAAESMHIAPYHPVTHYFASLPEWDGEDRLRPLMRRLTSDETMVEK